MTADDRKSARQWALKALGRRMHTVHEVRAALSRRGFEEAVIASLVEELGSLGYLDDLNFASVWVQSRSAHQLHGPMRLIRDLRQKGIPEEMARAAVSQNLPREEELAIAIRAAEKKMRTIRTSGTAGRNALYRHLRSRGFTNTVVNKVVADFTFEEDSS